MIVTERQVAHVDCMTLYGCLDAGSAPEVLQLLLNRIEMGKQQIILDLSRLDYASSAGLRVFLMVSRRMREQRGQILLAGLNSNVRYLFNIAGLSLLFEVVPNFEEALASLGIEDREPAANRQEQFHRIGIETEPGYLSQLPDHLDTTTPSFSNCNQPGSGTHSEASTSTRAAATIRKLTSNRGPGLLK